MFFEHLLDPLFVSFYQADFCSRRACRPLNRISALAPSSRFVHQPQLCTRTGEGVGSRRLSWAVSYIAGLVVRLSLGIQYFDRPLYLFSCRARSPPCSPPHRRCRLFTMVRLISRDVPCPLLPVFRYSLLPIFFRHSESRGVLEESSRLRCVDALRWHDGYGSGGGVSIQGPHRCAFARDRRDLERPVSAAGAEVLSLNRPYSR